MDRKSVKDNREANTTKVPRNRTWLESIGDTFTWLLGSKEDNLLLATNKGDTKSLKELLSCGTNKDVTDIYGNGYYTWLLASDKA